ncbi:hypothetical protein BOO86_21645 [Mycobacterium sp. CBMA 234]|uniref:ABC-three component system protein n=1 Tax=Mycolicibacterium sp. CBMA 234 TaxID=1918495 RepID=UPI001391F348|nr:ABC-three component system protein [Mycolicibacterium sp. CBMA 234]MUL67092.1 hypothetical protein [Mycolicibacterium sp. CBMA 234]
MFETQDRGLAVNSLSLESRRAEPAVVGYRNGGRSQLNAQQSEKPQIFASDLCDVPEPAGDGDGPALAGPAVSPQARISWYDDEEWERFVEEWVHALKRGYAQIKRFGGAGDRGADIAAFKTAYGLEGAWDCFQCKHYAAPLALSDVWPEMVKIFVAVSGNLCKLPDTYQFLAPRGCSTQCGRTLSSPSVLQTKFFERLDEADSKPIKGFGPKDIAAARIIALSADFSMFRSVELMDVLELHSTTRWHSARFATALKPRPAHVPAPGELASHESRYVRQLVDVYTEAHPNEYLEPESIASNPKVGARFRRQRENFYKAESLRVYARDAVPPGTFERLQDDIYSGIVDVVESDHSNGLARLTTVLNLVGLLDLNRHRLITVADIDDRKGICHQLANVDRVLWMQDHG